MIEYSGQQILKRMIVKVYIGAVLKSVKVSYFIIFFSSTCTKKKDFTTSVYGLRVGMDQTREVTSYGHLWIYTS